MIFSKQTKRNEFYIFSLLIIVLTISCGAVEQAEDGLTQIPPTPPSEQPVEYGASLSEWEEATQSDSEQMANDDSEGTASNGILVPELPQAASSNDGYPVTAAAESLSSQGYPAPESATATAETDRPVSDEGTPSTTLFSANGLVYQEIMWDALVPADFTADAIMAKYENELAQLEDGSPAASDLYSQMQAEFNSAPVNETLDGALVRIPGFIAPLEYSDDIITQFLLVPYFGACIHVPPPPANQTVLVQLPEGQGIKFEDAYNPFWVMGKLTAEGASTELAEAGYYIENALIELYTDGR